MSAILDAIKKSERDRKLDKLPRLQSHETPVEAHSRSLLPVVLLILFGIALALAIYFVAIRSTTTVSAIDGINIAAISFHDESDKRFAMINGKMYREGDAIADGVELIKIERHQVKLLVDDKVRSLRIR